MRYFHSGVAGGTRKLSWKFTAGNSLPCYRNRAPVGYVCFTSCSNKMEGGMEEWRYIMEPGTAVCTWEVPTGPWPPAPKHATTTVHKPKNSSSSSPKWSYIGNRQDKQCHRYTSINSCECSDWPSWVKRGWVALPWGSGSEFQGESNTTPLRWLLLTDC